MHSFDVKDRSELLHPLLACPATPICGDRSAESSDGSKSVGSTCALSATLVGPRSVGPRKEGQNLRNPTPASERGAGIKTLSHRSVDSVGPSNLELNMAAAAEADQSLRTVQWVMCIRGICPRSNDSVPNSALELSSPT